MIKIFRHSERHDCDEWLFDAMFRARATVFHDRLGWNVRVRNGLEIDRYDETANPAYLISLDESGQPTGSLRVLPTIGETMLGNEFATFFDNPVKIRNDRIWECTRFCIHPRFDPSHLGGEARRNGRRVSSDLLTGLCNAALSSGITHIIGLYDAHMTRVYRHIGWSPTPLATARPEIGKLVLGSWEVSRAAAEAMRERAEALMNPDFTKQAA